MAEQKFLDLTGLQTYDSKIKEKISTNDASTLQSAKDYADGLASNYEPAGSINIVKEELNAKITSNTESITALQSSKADKSTTLAGYGITNAYTKGETDSAIATAVANADHLKRQIVEVLPNAEEANESTIYMVGTGAGSEDSAYEEYMLINGAFEKIGSSAVDLTNYATKSYADGKATEAETNAKSYADSLAVNYATAAQGTKADTALQQADITTGKTNGTIKVKSTEVSVAGLKSAAYAETSAFDSAGTASGLVFALENGQVATNKNDITSIKGRLDALEEDTYTPISEEEITALFS